MKKEDKAKSLETLLVLVGAFIIAFWVTQKKIFLLLALVLIVIGITSSFITGKISWLWLKFSELIGSVMSKILLSVIYFIFLVPIALLYQLSKNDHLSLKRKKEGSYYIDRDHTYSEKDMENIW
jgi:hypothetical protein